MNDADHEAAGNELARLVWYKPATLRRLAGHLRALADEPRNTETAGIFRETAKAAEHLAKASKIAKHERERPLRSVGR